MFAESRELLCNGAIRRHQLRSVNESLLKRKNGDTGWIITTTVIITVVVIITTIIVTMGAVTTIKSLRMLI